ncbi:MAG: pectinesterase family protein [Bacteroidota bacterium]
MRTVNYILLLLALNSVPVFAWDFIVDQGGKGDFTTVQDAFDAVPDFRKNRTTIFVRNGIYKEKLVLPASKTNVSLVGEDMNRVILTNDDYASKKNRFGEEMGTTGSSTFFLFGDGFTAENITFENSSGPVGQAVALRIDGDMVAFRSCRFLGYQDTLYPHGEKSRQYYRDCYIEGTVDFIFGWSTAWFENCTIFCKTAGYITAPSTNSDNTYGFIFHKCRITGDAPEGSVYLGRPWRPFGNSVFLACTLSEVIRPEGWNNWDKAENEATARFAEWGNTGPGAGTGQRVEWSKQLTEKEALVFRPETVLGDWVSRSDLFIHQD